MHEKKVKLREQVAKKNAEVIKLRLETKKDEIQPEEEKKAAITGPSQEFLDRLQKSNKQKAPPITDWNVYRKRHELDSNQRIFIASNAY